MLGYPSLIVALVYNGLSFCRTGDQIFFEDDAAASPEILAKYVLSSCKCPGSCLGNMHDEKPSGRCARLFSRDIRE